MQWKQELLSEVNIKLNKTVKSQMVTAKCTLTPNTIRLKGTKVQQPYTNVCEKKHERHWTALPLAET